MAELRTRPTFVSCPVEHENLNLRSPLTVGGALLMITATKQVRVFRLVIKQHLQAVVVVEQQVSVKSHLCLLLNCIQ